MTCELIKELLVSYIDDECSVDENRLVKEHIETCEKCKSEYEALKTLFKGLDSIEEVEVPAGLHDDIMSEVKALETIDDKSLTNVTKVEFNYKKYIKYFSTVAALFIMVIMFNVFSKYILPYGNKESTTEMSYDSMQKEAKPETRGVMEKAAEMPQTDGTYKKDTEKEQAAIMFKGENVEVTEEVKSARENGDSMYNKADHKNEMSDSSGADNEEMFGTDKGEGVSKGVIVDENTVIEEVEIRDERLRRINMPLITGIIIILPILVFLIFFKKKNE